MSANYKAAPGYEGNEGARMRSAGALFLSIAAASVAPACSAGGKNPASAGGGSGGSVGGQAAPGMAIFASGGSASIGLINPGSAGQASAPPPIVKANTTPFVVDDTGTSGLAPDVIQKLKAGGPSCSFKILYPYEGAMFPVGLPDQTIEWSTPSDAAYIHLRYDGIATVDYQFAAGPTPLGQITIPQAAWNSIASRTPGSALKVTVTSIGNGTASTCETSWFVAPGVMTGSVYYNTYDAPGAILGGNGAIMRLTLGNVQSDIYEQFTGFSSPNTGPCTSCHSLAFQGQTMVASTHDYAAKSFQVSSYAVSPALQPPPVTKLSNAVFAALTPDGSRLLTMGNPQCTDGSDTFPRKPNNFPLLEGPDHAKLVDVATGRDIAVAGLNPDWYMWMPQFAPNGDKVVFNHAKPDGKGGTDRRELAVMDFDRATGNFSNLRVIASHLGPDPSLPYNPSSSGSGATATGLNACTSTGGMAPSPYLPPGLPSFGAGDVGALDPGTCTGPCYPAWPFFTPDGGGVIFQLSSEPDFASAFPGRTTPAKGEIWYVDLKSGKAVPLKNVNTPLDPADALTDYFPTVMPVAVGGKFWVFWTSRRAVGHRNYGTAVSSLFGGLPPGITIPGASGTFPPGKKRIWVSAIDINPAAGADPSHPGFYLAGQSDSGNIRAFSALNPCRQVKETCQSGLDCCTGFCTIPEGATAGYCAEQPPNACSRENDRCSSDADCCPPGASARNLHCLGGYCGFVSILR
jgi:hypothetical protein